MKLNKPLLAALGIITVCATGSAVALAANSDAGNGNQGTPPAIQDDVQTALDNSDYSAWKEAIESRPNITDYINEDNFDKYIEMRNLMREGKTDEADAIREELGLPDGPIDGMGGPGMHGPGGPHGDRDGSCNSDDASTESTTE